MDLQAIEARLAAATPGPWKAQDFVAAPTEDAGSAVVKQGNGGLVAYALRSGAVEHEWYDKPQCDADAEFIAHAPEDIRALIEEVGRLTVEHLEMRIERDDLRERRDYYRKALMKADGEIEAVEALHAKQTDPEVPEEKPWCGECRDAFGISLFWPCPTMRALGVTE